MAGVLDELCGREDIRAQDVVVLSAHGRDHSAIYGGNAGRWRYTDKRGGKANRVFFSSIRGFKGLESPVVVICELGDLDEESRDNQLYVGMSRARNHCVILAPKGRGNSPSRASGHACDKQRRKASRTRGGLQSASHLARRMRSWQELNHASRSQTS